VLLYAFTVISSSIIKDLGAAIRVHGEQ
jgi:hypothetical protein